jgi:hypothetical protein
VLRLVPLLKLFFKVVTLEQLERAMVTTAIGGYQKPVLEVDDIIDASEKVL